MNKGNILIIAANPTQSTTTGWPVGFWASEVTHPWHIFTEAGYDVAIASPEGGDLKMDAMSDPFDESGYSDWDELSKKVLKSEKFRSRLKNTPSVSDLAKEDFDAIVVAGGQAPMFNFEQVKSLHLFFKEFYETGKPTSALCHGTAVLRYIRDENGAPFVAGKKVTGFTNEEENDADAAAGQKVMPWRIEDELTILGAHFKKGEKWKPFVVVDENLITGQQNMSGEAVAEKIVETLSKH
jgi:putative intracellular protease/amidase